MNPRYPIYVPSRNRWQRERALTIRVLRKDRVPFRVVVSPRPDKASPYESWVGPENVLRIPSDDMNLLETRNWIRDHAEGEGHARHWQLDDNIREFRRLWKGRRIPCHAGVALRVCEDFSDRYENVGISGLNYQMFVPADTPAPYYHNVHVYSISLINHKMPYRWRLVYNDDTDLCLQALTHGWCTILINAFMADKIRTMTLGGGNTQALYRLRNDSQNGSDTMGRFEMARVLERAWPGLVTLGRRFERYQHIVDWRQFDTPLRPRPDVDLGSLPDVDEYGLRLRAIRPVRSPILRAMLPQ